MMICIKCYLYDWPSERKTFFRGTDKEENFGHRSGCGQEEVSIIIKSKIKEITRNVEIKMFLDFLRNVFTILRNVLKSRFFLN